MLRSFLLVLAVSFAAGPAAAQEDYSQDSVVRTEKPSITIVSSCDRPEGLCLRPRVAHLLAPVVRARQAAGAFNTLTRAAGMLMGRVEAAQVGAFRLRVVLDLR